VANCAFLIFEAATISIALVIFLVLVMDLMRLLMIFVETAMAGIKNYEL